MGDSLMDLLMLPNIRCCMLRTLLGKIRSFSFCALSSTSFHTADTQCQSPFLHRPAASRAGFVAFDPAGIGHARVPTGRANAMHSNMPNTQYLLSRSSFRIISTFRFFFISSRHLQW
jgi:hypothetical protein